MRPERSEQGGGVRCRIAGDDGGDLVGEGLHEVVGAAVAPAGGEADGDPALVDVADALERLGVVGQPQQRSEAGRSSAWCSGSAPSNT